MAQYHLVRDCGTDDVISEIRTSPDISSMPMIPKSSTEKYFGSVYRGIRMSPMIFTATLPKPKMKVSLIEDFNEFSIMVPEESFKITSNNRILRYTLFSSVISDQ